MLSTRGNPKFEAAVRAAFPDAADQILGLIRGAIDPATVPAVAQWIARCYHPPSRPELVMAAIDAAIDGCGVEAIFSDDSCTWPYACYVNLGDTYDCTICWIDDDYDGSGVYRVSRWGDVIEGAEAKGVRFQ